MSYKKLSEIELAAFAIRLNEVCDDMGLAEKFKGRHIDLSKVVNGITGENITPNAARKWLEGEGFPSTDKMIHIARWAGVSTEWFLSGAGEKKPLNVLSYGVNTTLSNILHVAENLSEYKKTLALNIINSLAETPDKADIDAINAQALEIEAIDKQVRDNHPMPLSAKPLPRLTK